MTCAENFVTNDIDDSHYYQLPSLYKSRSYQVYGCEDDFIHRFGMSQFSHDELARLSVIPYKAHLSGGKQKRLLGRLCNLFQSDDLTRLLPSRELKGIAFLGESYAQAFTLGLLQVYHRWIEDLDARDENLIPNVCKVLGVKGGGYVDLDLDGNWWIPSRRSFFNSEKTPLELELAEARRHFFLTQRVMDSFGNN
jgi:hypothetical protein